MKYYLTTPLYYVNAAPHIGHTYTTMAAETIARFKRMQGYDAVMFTGTDEHGQKVERSAEAAGKTPQEFTDTIAAEFSSQWEKLNIRVDRTIRTTNPKHHKVVQNLFQRCMDNGYVYKGSYTGQYCVSLRRLPCTEKSFENSPWQAEQFSIATGWRRVTGSASVTGNASTWL